MNAADALWHLLNFVAPALVVGALVAGLAKLLWRHELKGLAWRVLAGWAAGAGVAALLVGLLLSGSDGRMASYAGMCLACAAALWWRGFMAKA